MSFRTSRRTFLRAAPVTTALAAAVLAPAAVASAETGSVSSDSAWRSGTPPSVRVPRWS